jgi:hypothetical protein
LTIADLALELVGAGSKTATPYPLQGRFSVVGMASFTSYAVNVPIEYVTFVPKFNLTVIALAAVPV